MKRLSIKERMDKAKSLSVRLEIAHDWSVNWQSEHDGIIRNLERALKINDVPHAGRALGQLKTMTEKRFSGLTSVIEALSDEDAA